jgi:predicted flap endonuclease-1-like 5' DNA nuclease
MDTGTTLVIIIEVGVLILLGYVVYSSSRSEKKPTQAAPPKPKPSIAEEKKVEPVSEPAPSLPEEPKGEEVKAVEPPQKSASVEAPAEAAKVVEAKPKKTTKAAEKKEHGFNIVDIEGIGKRQAEKLHKINIYTTAELLKAGATAHGRRELSEKTGIDAKLILEWVNLSDLFRIKGIGEEYSDLLEEAGVDTVVELSKRNAEHLHAKIIEVNEAKKLVRRPPPLSSVEAWVEEAKSLPRVIEY